MTTEVEQSLYVQRTAALPVPDNTQTTGAPRGGRYGEQGVLSYMPPKKMASDEGSYYVVTNPAIGTTVTYALQTTFSDTAALFAIQNTDIAGGKRIYLDTMRLMLSGTAPATTTVMDFAVKLDIKDRTPTAGNATITPVCTNGDIKSAKSIANFQAFSAAAITVPTSGLAATTVSRTRIPTSLGITGDEYIVQFGFEDVPGTIPGLTAVRATAAARLVAGATPIIIAPQQWCVIYMWWTTATTTAPAFEYEFGWIER